MTTQSLTNQFLIAMPALGDPNFHQSVTLICEHTENGALGLIINRPLDLTLDEIFAQLSIETRDASLGERHVLAGGPVQPERGFVVHHRSHEWESTLGVSETLAVTTSRDVLVSIAGGDGPDPAIVALGYAGWSAGQLEREIQDNAWLSVPADQAIIFDTPYEKRWPAAAKLLGVDLDRLSNQAGPA